MSCHSVVEGSSFNTQNYPEVLGELYRILSPWVVFFVLCHQLSTSFGKSMSSSEMEQIDEEKAKSETIGATTTAATKDTKDSTPRPQEGTVDMYLWFGPWGLLRNFNPWVLYRQMAQHPIIATLIFTDSHPVVAFFLAIIVVTCLLPVLTFLGFLIGTCLFGILSFVFFEGLMLIWAVLGLVSILSCCVCFSALISSIFGAAVFVYQNTRGAINSARRFARPLLSKIPLGPFKTTLLGTGENIDEQSEMDTSDDEN